MKKKQYIIYLILAIFLTGSFFYVFVDNVNASSQIAINSETGAILQYSKTLRTSDGVLHCFFFGNDNKLHDSKSYNDGLTWQSAINIFSTTQDATTQFDACILSNNTMVLMVIFANSLGVYWYNNASMTMFYNIGVHTAYYDVKICTDNMDNVHLLYKYYNSVNDVQNTYRIYRNDLKSWSAEIVISNNNNDQTAVNVNSIFVDEDYNIFISYEYKTGSYTYFKVARKSISATSFTSVTLETYPTNVVFYNTKIIEMDNTDIVALVNFDTFSYLYQITEYTLNYDFVDVGDITNSFEVVNDSYNNYMDSVQLKVYNDDKIDIMLRGTGYYHSNSLLRNIEVNYLTEDIGTEGYITSGTYTTIYGKYVYSLYPDFMNVYNGYSVAYKNSTASEYMYYTYSNDLLYLSEYYDGGDGGGGTESETQCSGGYYGDDRHITAKYLETYGGTWNIQDRTIQQIKIVLTENQYLLYNDLTYYDANIYNGDSYYNLGQPDKWQHILTGDFVNYYYLIWENVNFYDEYEGMNIEFRNNYTEWYYLRSVTSYLKYHDNDAYWQNNAYTDGTMTIDTAGLTICVVTGVIDTEYDITFESNYNDIDCMPYNQEIIIDYYVTPGSPVYYLLEDSTYYDITEGGWGSSANHFTFEYYIDQSYGVGTYYFTVIPYSLYLLHGDNKSYGETYTFCVTWGQNKSEFIMSDKTQYFEYDTIYCIWRGAVGVSYTISYATYDKIVIGDGNIHKELNGFVARAIGQQLPYRTYVSMEYTSNATECSRYYFTIVENPYDAYLNILHTDVSLYSFQHIGGSTGGGAGFSYIAIYCNGVWKKSFDCPKNFNFNYQCNEIGVYKVILYIDGAEQLTRSWTCSKGPTSGDIFDFSNIPTFFKIIGAIIIILTLTISPLIIAMMVNKKGIQINIPPLVYVAFFFFGLIVSILIGFLEVWVIFVILFGLIIYFAITWLNNNRGG